MSTLPRRVVVCALCAFVLLSWTACTGTRGAYPHADEAIGSVREIYDGTLSPRLAVQTFRNIDRLFPSRVVEPSSTPRALRTSQRVVEDFSFTIDTPTGSIEHTFEDYLRANRVAGILVLVDGEVALERYGFGNTEATRWMSMSLAKSITSTLLGAAIQDGSIESLDDDVTRYVPKLRGSAYDGVRVCDVLTMSSGVRWDETYTDPASDRRRLLEAQIAQVEGGTLAVMAALPRIAEPGTRHNYSTGETQVAGEIVRGATGRFLADYLSERIWQPAGMADVATWWLESPGGIEIGGSGFSATLRDYARFGQFVLDDGVVRGRRILPEGWVRAASQPARLRDGREIAYGRLWWPATSEASRRDGAFLAEGIHGQFLYVNPAARVVIVALGAQPLPIGGSVIDDYAVFDAIVAEVRSLRR